MGLSENLHPKKWKNISKNIWNEKPGRSYKLGKELLYPVQQDSGDYFLFLVDGNFAVIPEKEAKIKLKQER